MQVKEETSEEFIKSGSQYGGVTIGIGNLLYNVNATGTNKEDRSDAIPSRYSVDSTQRYGDESTCTGTTGTSEYLVVGKSSVSCTYSTSDESSIEVSMPVNQGYEFDTNNKTCDDALHEKARLAQQKYMEEEARLEDQKRLVREQLLADEVRLVEMTRETKACHLQKDELLSKLAEDTRSVDKTCKEDIKLSETLQNMLVKLKQKRSIFKSLRLKEEKELLEEEKRLAEKRRLFEEAYQLEEARLAEQTRSAEDRLLEQARLAEERHKAVQKRLEEITLKVERAREEAEQARLLVDYDPRINDSLTFDSSFSVGGERLHTLSEEKTYDKYSAEIGYDCLPKHHWRELDASMFTVRGDNYFQDSKKVRSAPNLLRLMTVDVIEVAEPMMTGICSHPRGRVSLRDSTNMLIYLTHSSSIISKSK